MSNRAQSGITIVAILLLLGGAFYWLQRSRSGMPQRIQAASPAESVAPDPTKETLVSAGNATDGLRSAATPDAGKSASDPAKPSGFPLRNGEVLDFTADVSKFSNVATLRLDVAERRNFLGKSAWHLQAFAHTGNPLRMILELDDQFDSYSDAETLHSLQYELHLNEHGQKVDSVQRLSASGKDAAPANATLTRVLPGTRDPLGMMQYLRNVDWSSTPEVRSPVYDGHKLYDVRAKLSATNQEVTVPAGKYVASKIDIHVFDNGVEMKDAQFSLYVAKNAAHTPVLLEAVLPFATARVQLAKVQ